MNKFLHNARDYTAYRPQYTSIFYEYLAGLIPNKNILVDCGAGSGQAAFGFAKYFNEVIATDLSYELLISAPKIANIIYVQAEIEHLPIQSQSIDMICIAQALHWFSLNEFYQEVTRVLKPTGIIAAWCYNQCTVESGIDSVIRKIYTLVSSPENMSVERKYVYDHYQHIPFPFNKMATPQFDLVAHWNLAELYGYIATWPGLLEYEKKFNANILQKLEEEFISVWGDVTERKKIKWPINLLVGRLYS